jgi:hypothetical protein
MDARLTRQRKVQLAATVVWLIATLAYGWWYVRSQLGLPGLEGYEAQWQAQAWFFALIRGPVALAVLALLLLLEQGALHEK